MADLQAQLAAATEERAEAEQRAGAAEDILEDHEGWEPVGEIPGMEEAQEQLGRPVIIDDLKVVEGIGPQVEEVLQSAGITNWAALANSTPQVLRDVLSGAGPQFNAHDPTTWPQQAVLAIGGHWETLRSLQDSLRGGRTYEPTRHTAAGSGALPAARAASMRAVVSRRLPKASRSRLPTSAITYGNRRAISRVVT